MSDVERAREIERLARQVGGGMEGLLMGFNGFHGYFTAAVTIAGPRSRPRGGRWRRGRGTTPSTALAALLSALQDEL